MKNKFWDHFDKLMSSLPGYINEEIEDNTKEYKSSNGLFTSKSVTVTSMQNGKTIKVKTVNGKTTVTVNGKEYIEKEVEKK
jgi:carbonic anhydrase